MTLYQNYSNCFAPLHKMDTRAKNRKTFNKLLLYQWMYFEIIIHACSLGDPLPILLKLSGSVKQLHAWSLADPLPILLKLSGSVEQMAARAKNKQPLNEFSVLTEMATRAKNRKTFNKLLLLYQWMDFEIIIHACSLGDSLPILLKLSGSVEQNGRQGYKKTTTKI